MYANEIQIVLSYWKKFQYKSRYKFHSLFSMERSSEKILHDNNKKTILRIKNEE